MKMHSTVDLERELRAPDRDFTGGPDLALIRRHGRRRRRGRIALAAAGGLLATSVLFGTAVTLVNLRDEGGREAAPASVTLQKNVVPETMHPLAERALREVPGAVKVSATQVVIPGPGVPEEQADAIGENGRPPLVGTPVPLPGHLYNGVTAFPISAFPAWLHDGVADYEETVLANDDGSYPVGSTDIGILVDAGVGQLGCTDWPASERHDNANCWPALMEQVGEKRYLRSSLGTEEFLTPGAAMEVFLADDYSTGRRTTLAIAGLDGTDVARVEFVPVSGSPVTGTVRSGAITEGDSLFYANVTGVLQRVVAYDDAGRVIDDHEVRPCSGAEDCEVR